MLVRWLMRRFVSGSGMTGTASQASAAETVPIPLHPDDYQQFETMLHRVQAAWSTGGLATLQRLTTPEMAATFAHQLQELHARGLRNEVSDVRLLQGDLSEAWHESGAEYATVAMRFSMIGVTHDAAGRLVDGAPGEHVQTTELRTFRRPPGDRRILSAIQQAG